MWCRNNKGRLSTAPSPEPSPAKEDKPGEAHQLVAVESQQVNQVVAAGHRQVPSQIQSDIYICTSACMYIYITHQVLSRASSCSGSDVPSSPPIRARHAADIYKMYNVTMPTCFDVPSSPEQILSQEARTPEVQYRLKQKTPPRKQVPAIDQKSISPTEQTPFS